MKYFTSALVIVALFNTQATNAVQLRAEFSDDLMKDLAADLSKDENLA